MSVSKLESFPNEILIDLLEKYINGVDVLVTFANQLNSRFNALVNRCQQLHFDFTSIRKKDFHICVNLLPDYLSKVRSLTLSKHDTPELIHTFLSLFPSLDKFNELRGFHLDFDVATIDQYGINEALHSLSKTSLSTLSIKAAYMEFAVLTFINRIILSLSTLKRLVLDINIGAALWSFQEWTSINIEHLTIAGQGCTWNELQHISRCTPHLKYLNMRVRNNLSNNSQSTVKEQVDIPRLLRLRIVILYFIDRYTEVTWDKLVQYFHIMPNLHHLEVTNSHNRFFSANDWQMLFETSLSLLTHFTLKIIAARLSQHGLDSIHNTLTYFQTPFWIEKKNFNIFIMMCKCFGDVVLNYQPIDPRRHRFDIHFNSEIESGTTQFWTVPERSINDNRFIMDSITSLRLSAKYCLPLNRYYFENIKCLKVDHLNSFLLKWITTHIHISNITELMISGSETEFNVISSLITITENISSLQINFNQWIIQQFRLIRTNRNIKRLDISFCHLFDQSIYCKEDIRVIADLFPLIEHLKIDTIDLESVPFLYICLPHLHSLTFKIIDPAFPTLDKFKQQQWIIDYEEEQNFYSYV